MAMKMPTARCGPCVQNTWHLHSSLVWQLQLFDTKAKRKDPANHASRLLNTSCRIQTTSTNKLCHANDMRDHLPIFSTVHLQARAANLRLLGLGLAMHHVGLYAVNSQKIPCGDTRKWPCDACIGSRMPNCRSGQFHPRTLFCSILAVTDCILDRLRAWLCLLLGIGAYRPPHVFEQS